MFYDRLLWVRDKNKSVFKFCDDFVQPKRNGHFVNGIEFICFRCHCSLRSILQLEGIGMTFWPRVTVVREWFPLFDPTTGGFYFKSIRCQTLCHTLLNIHVGKETIKSKYILKFGYRSFGYKFIHSRCKQFHVLGLESEDIHSKCFSCSLANYS